MRTRILVGALLVACLAGVFLLDRHVLPSPFLSRVLVWLLAIGLLHEVLALGARKIDVAPGLAVTGAAALVIVAVPYVISKRPVPGAILALAALLAGGIRFLHMAPVRSAPVAFPEAALLAGAVAYAGGLLAFVDRLLVHGVVVAYAIVAISKTSDVCGFFVGSLVGRKRIAPSVSPKKTWEGTIAGVLGSIGVAILLTPELPGPPWFTAIIGALLALATFMGDLLASGIKRWAGAKDSSSFLPEFGGILDLVDGLLLAAPVAIVCLYGS